METVQVRDKLFIPYLRAEAIAQRVKEVAAAINSDYADRKPLLIAILNGSFVFAADLFKNIVLDAEISFIKLASYQGTKSTGKVLTAIGLDANITGRDVIIIEDIIDTGKTLHAFLPQLQNQHPASIKIAVLLHKPEATIHEIPIDYTCFSIPNKFVVGYGLDYDGLGRNLPSIYQLYEGE